MSLLIQDALFEEFDDEFNIFNNSSSASTSAPIILLNSPLIHKQSIQSSIQPQNNNNSQSSTVLKPKKRKSPSKKFVWAPETHFKFVRLVAVLGLKTVKPKQLFCYLSQFGLSCEQIGSHLQKYKLKIQCIYQLMGFEEFENWMHAEEYASEICQKWAEKGFNGYTVEEIRRIAGM
ncbi:Conserved_hypothetical protein [Hexamita inflata]|uniref:Uncharacterized protein n=1 Tax=Hexamita inflata TaxID=28002 RepID=A0AA86QTM7_9EUKA|nr:Conserved hypothetical protein [Hexamita inflata]CAI9959089.1 Conserved hypothetical protein [Hexamita inflata]